jgi:FkbM family methyltransferase
MDFFPKLIDTTDFVVRVFMRLYGYVFPVLEGTTFFGSKISCHIRDFIQRRIYFFHVYEPNLTYFIVANVKPGDVFVDLGANIGYFSLLASQLVGPNGRVVSIEAAPETFQALTKNLERNGCANVNAVNVAATKDVTTIEIISPQRGNIGANEIRPATGSNKGTIVDGRPLLAILGDKAPQVGFIKIDIEGSEGPILQDILDHLDAFPKRLIIVAEIARSSAEFVQKFRDTGFDTYGLPNNYRIGYLLIRRYLARTGEQTFWVTCPLDRFAESFTDYVFVRQNS